MDKSATIPNTQLPQGSDNLVKIQESYVNIQVDEQIITRFEEFNKNVPIIVNNNQIQDILAANNNTT